MKMCESQSENLSALADGELTGWAAWRLRRHIAACPACARELADWQHMNAALRVADTLPVRSPAEAARTPLPAEKRPIYARSLIAGAVVAASIAAGIFYNLPTPSGSNAALAAREEVDEAMSGLHTAQWRSEGELYGLRGEFNNRQVTIYRAQLDTPAYFWNRQQFALGQTQPFASGTARTDRRGQTAYMVMHQERRLFLWQKRRGDIEPPTPDCQTIAQRIRRTIYLQMFTSPKIEREKLAESAPSPRKGPTRVVLPPKVRTITQNGRRLIEISDGFEFRNPDGLGFYYTLRADATTHRLVETEEKMIELKTHLLHSRSRSFDYRYNEPLPPNAFTVPMPSGIPIRCDGKAAGVTP